MGAGVRRYARQRAKKERAKREKEGNLFEMQRNVLRKYARKDHALIGCKKVSVHKAVFLFWTEKVRRS